MASVARSAGCAVLAVLGGGILSATTVPVLTGVDRQPQNVDDLVASGCAVLALLLYGWLLLGAVCTVAGALGGRLGSSARAVAVAVAPVAWRRTVRAACGIAVAALPVTASPGVFASTDHATGARAEQVKPSLDGLPMPDRPTGRPLVVVRAGDTLWSIAAAALPPAASTARIARTWPQWYAANRQRVGADPDLIVPGTVLRPPAHRPEG